MMRRALLVAIAALVAAVSGCNSEDDQPDYTFGRWCFEKEEPMLATGTIRERIEAEGYVVTARRSPRHDPDGPVDRLKVKAGPGGVDVFIFADVEAARRFYVDNDERGFRCGNRVYFRGSSNAHGLDSELHRVLTAGEFHPPP